MGGVHSAIALVLLMVSVRFVGELSFPINQFVCEFQMHVIL